MKISDKGLDFADVTTNPKYLYCENCDMRDRDEIMVGTPTGEETEYYFECPDCGAEYYQHDTIPGLGYLAQERVVEEEEPKKDIFENFLGSSDSFFADEDDDDYTTNDGICLVCGYPLGDAYDGVCDMCAHTLEVEQRNEEVEEYWVQHFGPRDEN